MENLGSTQVVLNLKAKDLILDTFMALEHYYIPSVQVYRGYIVSAFFCNYICLFVCLYTFFCQGFLGNYLS